MRCGVLLSGLLFFLLASTASATTLVVTTVADTVANDGECSLREAMLNVEAGNQSGSTDCPAGDPGGSVIEFSADLIGQTIVLSGQTLPIITRNLDIIGPDSGNPGGLTIDADDQSRHFRFQQAEQVTLSDLTLINGRGPINQPGGSVLIEEGASASFNRVHLLNNATFPTLGRGGAVGVINGAAHFSDSELANNQSVGHGGAVYASESVLSFEHSQVVGNSASASNPSNAQGGGIWLADGSLSFSNGMISDNTAAGPGGGVFAENSTLSVSNAHVSGNSTDTIGGGMALEAVALDITTTTISGNQAGSSTAGLRVGANSTGQIRNSTFSGNSSGGGGIALRVSNSSVDLIHVTVAFHETTQNQTVIWSESNVGGSDQLRVINSLLFGRCFAQPTSPIINIGSMASGPGCGSPALPEALFELAPLADNGGFAATHALGAGSVAIAQAGDCVQDWEVSEDQRGQARPGLAGRACDVGAYESTFAANVADLALSISPSVTDIQLGQPATFLIEVEQAGPQAAIDIEVAIDLPAGLSFNSASASSGAYDPGTGVWLVGALAAGESASLSLVATGQALGEQTLAAEVSASTPDPVPSNNAASATIEVWPVPGALVVTTLADQVLEDGACSLREAILQINDGEPSALNDCAPGNLFGYLNEIRFDPSLAEGIIALNGTALPVLATGMRIEGPLAEDARGITLDAGGQSRIFEAAGDHSVTLVGLTLTGGRVEGSGEHGGAVLIKEGVSLRMEHARIMNNEAAGSGSGGGAVAAVDSAIELFDCELGENNSVEGDGGAIHADNSNLNLIRCLLASNKAGVGRGGAVYADNESRFTYLENTTISNNLSGLDGGGLHVTGELYVTFSTLYNNVAGSGAMDLFVQKLQPVAFETLYIWHSLIVQELPGVGSCTVIGSILDRQSSLSTDAACLGVASSAADIGLQPLADNGGPTRTHALAPDSIAVNMGDPECSNYIWEGGLFHDQRNQQRPGIGSTTCDAGAYERQVIPVDQIFSDRFSSP
ncbi:MAG: CSLREA domain-containing protein [Wenzhouxiangella sp.]|nr:CSLREA domain-containing protein [Wenzhouxiangella sp.]